MSQVDSGVLIAIIGAVSNIVFSLIPATFPIPGWIKRTQGLAGLYASLPAEDRSVHDEIVAWTLADEIYKRIMQGLHYRDVDGVPQLHRPWWITYRLSIVWTFALLVFFACMSAFMDDWSLLAHAVIGSAAGIVIGLVMQYVLERWPKQPWNKLYVTRRESDKLHEELVDKVESLENARRAARKLEAELTSREIELENLENKERALSKRLQELESRLASQEVEWKEADSEQRPEKTQGQIASEED